MRTLYVLLLLAALRPEAHAALDNREIRAMAAAAGLEYQLRDDLQRPIDPRLAKIESAGLEASGLFRGRTHVVRSAREIQALSGRLSPGDQLVLAGAAWRDARFTFNGRGTEAAPILIRPEKPGSVVFSGASAVSFHGSHLIISGLAFKAVALPRDQSTIFRLGLDRDRPADHCIVHRIRIEDCNSPSAADWPRQKLWYLTVNFGRDNTVAHSTFSGLRHLGQMIGAANLPPKELQRLHILNNRFSDRPFLDDQNGYEIIQIGWSAEMARPAGSLIQGNTFENCDGENETITLKASDVVVRGNTFAGCQGVLCLRTARRVLVQGNVFDSRGRPNTGGVRMQGFGHVVIENTFLNLKRPRNHYYWPISLMSASSEDYGDQGDVAGYGRAKQILIARNRFEYCDARIAAGIFPRPAYPLLPRDIRARDNVFTGSAAPGAFDYVAPDPTGALTANLQESGNQFLP